MLENAIRTDIRTKTAYAIADIPHDFIKLDAMEVPYQFPEPLQRELANQLAAAPINRYPNPAASGLQAQLHQAFNIPESCQIALGNGSDELIQMLTLLVAQPNRTMLALEPSFVMYRHNAQLFGMDYVSVPLNPDFSLNSAATLAAIREHQPSIIFISHPNNPTGVPFRHENIQEIIRAATGIVVIDEAYGAFSADSFLAQAGQPENMVVMRTLSKIGFAGLRLGYAVGHANLINELNKIMPPYNMNWLSLTAAKFALQHTDWIDGNIAVLIQQREILSNKIKQLNGTTVFPSQANFITVRVPDADFVFNHLKNNKILIKNLHGGHPLLENCLRLTVGTPEQNQKVLNILNNILI